jgi:hypothetical protein
VYTGVYQERQEARTRAGGYTSRGGCKNYCGCKISDSFFLIRVRCVPIRALPDANWRKTAARRLGIVFRAFRIPHFCLGLYDRLFDSFVWIHSLVIGDCVSVSGGGCRPRRPIQRRGIDVPRTCHYHRTGAMLLYSLVIGDCVSVVRRWM